MTAILTKASISNVREPQAAETLDSLADQLAGQLLRPADPAYDAARRIWNGMVDVYPEAIVRCHSALDVACALRFAIAHKLPFSVRGGGHNTAGYALCEGLVIDLTQMKELVVDAHRMRVRAGAGLTFGEFVHGLESHGLVVPTGTCSGTGIAGATLGGGIGWLMGKFGLAADNVVAVELVTPEGNVVRAEAGMNDEEHADLFWAVRGGGGNFGIVTAIEYRTHPLAGVYAGVLVYPQTRAAEVLRLYRTITTSAPDELTVMCVLTAFPNVGPAALLSFCWCGSETQAERFTAPLYSLGSPAFTFAQQMPYSALLAMNDAATPDGRRYFDTTFSLSELSDAAIAALVSNAGAATSPFSGIIFQHVHGAATRVAATATAYPFRHPHYAVVNSAAWEEGDDARHVAWAKACAAAMQPYASRGAYVNFLGADGNQAVQDAYGPNYARLAAIKQRYDPNNYLRRNQNIRPAGQPEGL